MTLLMGMRASEVADRVVRDLDDGGRLLWIPRAKTAAGVRRLRVPELLRPLLLALANGRQPEDRLFQGATRWWLHDHVTAICRRAKVPVVGPHSMRGLHATLATAGGATAAHVAASLGHESFEVTARHYADGDVLAAVTARAAGELLASSPPVPHRN
jgi:integrase